MKLNKLSPLQIICFLGAIIGAMFIALLIYDGMTNTIGMKFPAPDPRVLIPRSNH